jgi:hypothetical protein
MCGQMDRYEILTQSLFYAVYTNRNTEQILSQVTFWIHREKKERQDSMKWQLLSQWSNINSFHIMYVADGLGGKGAAFIYYSDIHWVLECTLSARRDLCVRHWSSLYASVQLGRGNLSLHLTRMCGRFRGSDDNALRFFCRLQTAENRTKRNGFTFDAKMDPGETVGPIQFRTSQIQADVNTSFLTRC